MPTSAGTDVVAGVQRRLTNYECRAIRLQRERAALLPLLERLLVEMPDAIRYDFRDLADLAGYRILEPEGLVHAAVVGTTGCTTIIGATRRLLRKPSLRRRLHAVRKLARTGSRRVVVLGPRGLILETARLRARTEGSSSLVAIGERRR